MLDPRREATRCVCSIESQLQRSRLTAQHVNIIEFTQCQKKKGLLLIDC